MKHKASWILAIALVIAGCVLHFAMPGHDFLGYTLWGIAVLVLLWARLHRVGRTVLSVLVCAGLIVFAFFEIPVVRDARTDLGANPDALAVVSGGQGEGEDITEAEAMADYLTAHGIDSARIVQEDQSRTTRENLENSFAILRARGYDPADGVGIVTSEYHLCRAKRMARALGAEPVGIAAETTLPSMRINYFIREAFAAAYMQLAGTLY